MNPNDQTQRIPRIKDHEPEGHQAEETLGFKIFKIALGSVLGTGFVSIVGLLILKVCFMIADGLF